MRKHIDLPTHEEVTECLKGMNDEMLLRYFGFVLMTRKIEKTIAAIEKELPPEPISDELIAKEYSMLEALHVKTAKSYRNAQYFLIGTAVYFVSMLVLDTLYG